MDKDHFKYAFSINTIGTEIPNLETTDKTIAGAINELKEKIKDKKFSEHIDVVYNIHLLSLNYKLDENNLDFNMQLYVNLNT
ncbi:hypothetical protein, partial [Borreliella valaisiana]